MWPTSEPHAAFFFPNTPYFQTAAVPSRREHTIFFTLLHLPPPSSFFSFILGAWEGAGGCLNYYIKYFPQEKETRRDFTLWWWEGGSGGDVVETPSES